MEDSQSLLVQVLRLCDGAAPNPWYPSQFAGDRDRLDAALIDLRLAGLIRLTDWQAGVGQGYRLTEQGATLLQSPRMLERLAQGKIPESLQPTTEAPKPRVSPRNRSERDSIFTVNNFFIALMLLTFGIAMQSALRAGVPFNKFLAQGISPILNSLSLQPDAVVRGEWWRLWTYALVHVGGLHLFMNVYGHLIDGPITENMYGHGRFFVIYMLATFGGSMASLLTGRAVAGSSGAWCGLIGAQIAFILFQKHNLPMGFIRAWKLRTVHVVFLTALISSLPNVSWEAHLGGALAGFAAGALLNLKARGGVWNWLGLLGLLMIPAIGLGWVSGKGQVLARQTRLRDVRDIQNLVAPLTSSAYQKVSDFLDDEADPLRDIAPEKRNAADVQNVLGKIEQLKAETKRALDTLVRRPFLTPQAEDARQISGEALIVQMGLLEQYQALFQKSANWSADDEGKLLSLRDMAVEQSIRFRQAIKAVSQE